MVPVSRCVFRRRHFASRSSDSRQGIGPSSRSAYRARPAARTQTGLPRSARTSCDRGGCPLYPEDSGAHPIGSPPRPAPAASQRQSLYPATTSHRARLRFTRHQQGFNHVHPSGLPLAHTTGVEPAALRLPPELRTPPLPAAHVRGGDRPSSTDLELPLNSHPSISNPVVHSMRATSRRTAKCASPAAGPRCPAFAFARASARSMLIWLALSAVDDGVCDGVDPCQPVAELLAEVIANCERAGCCVAQLRLVFVQPHQSLEG